MKDPLEYLKDEFKKAESTLADVKWEYRLKNDYIASSDFKKKPQAEKCLKDLQELFPQLQGAYVGEDMKGASRFWIIIPTKAVAALSKEVKEPSSSVSEKVSVFKQKHVEKEEKSKRPPDVSRPSGLGPKK